jgi:hypothetical protein
LKLSSRGDQGERCGLSPRFVLCFFPRENFEISWRHQRDSIRARDKCHVYIYRGILPFVDNAPFDHAMIGTENDLREWLSIKDAWYSTNVGSG